MPLYEYKCKSCETRYQIFHKSISKEVNVECPECGSKDYNKLFSTFSASASVNASEAPACSSGNCPAFGSSPCQRGNCNL